MAKKFYGCVPQILDSRDILYTLAQPRGLPPSVDSLAYFITAYDQGALGSCTGHGVGRVWEHRLFVETSKLVQPARLFIYYNGRALEGNAGTDAGASIRDVMKGVASCGVPPEKDWPYKINKFAVKPSLKAYKDALKEIALVYQSVPVSLDAVKAAIAAGNPVVGGFAVYPSFESFTVAKTGIMSMPASNEKVIGGHCVCWDSYNDSEGMFGCFNSWGDKWGIQGRFKMPYEYLKYCWDFWVLLKLPG